MVEELRELMPKKSKNLPHFSENRFLFLAARAASQRWEPERAKKELISTFGSEIRRQELYSALKAIAGPDLPAEMAVWMDCLIGTAMVCYEEVEEVAWALHLVLVSAWLSRAQAGDPQGEEMASLHGQYVCRLFPWQDPKCQEWLKKIEEEPLR